MKKNTSETDEFDQTDDQSELDEPKKLTKGQIKQLKSLISFNRQKTKETVRLCPQCVFSAVKIIPSYANFLAPSRFFCPKCNWQGPIALEAYISDLEQYLKDNPIGSSKHSSEKDMPSSCSHCGIEIKPGSQFCPSCGKEI